MRHRMILTVLGAAAAVALITGCTTTSQGQPQRQPIGTSEATVTETSTASPPPSTSQGDGQLPSHGAPKVKNPMDTSRYQQNPCQVLTQAQLQELNLPAQGEQKEAPLGLKCVWANRETGGSVEIQWAVKDGRGLSGNYWARSAGRYAFFVELPEIEGFPAVAHGTSDLRDMGDCTLSVGVTDRVIFQTGLGLSLRNIGQRDPCELLVRVAGMMVRTMKAGG